MADLKTETGLRPDLSFIYFSGLTANIASEFPPPNLKRARRQMKAADEGGRVKAAGAGGRGRGRQRTRVAEDAGGRGRAQAEGAAGGGQHWAKPGSIGRSPAESSAG